MSRLSPMRGPEALPHQVTSYVGRTAELEEIKRLHGSARLITLTGPGGVGKTRLLLRAIDVLGPSYPDAPVPVWLVELREPELLVTAVATRLGSGEQSARPPIELLIDHLRDRRVLLVLDNCEHLVAACAWLVDTLLRSCPQLVVLATSRQSLGVNGEKVLPVLPLGVPEAAASVTGLERYDAVRLLVDRATAVVPSFAVTEDNAADVARLCQAVDGLPLAIELAAVRLRVLSVGQLADRLHHRLTLLSHSGPRSGRHDALREVIDWSYDLCTAQERLLWSRSAVFEGGFDLESAEQVCSGAGLGSADVLDAVDGLIDKSILTRVDEGVVIRYRMLETVREYGQERLRAGGDETLVRRRHRDWFAQLGSRFAADWFGSGQVAWIDRLTLDMANLRLALDFCTSDPVEAVTGLRLVYDVRENWLLGDHPTEGRLWLRRLLPVAPPDAPGQAGCLWLYAFLALLQTDLPAYEASIAAAAGVVERTGDTHAGGYVSTVRAYAALIGNNGPVAAELFQQAIEALRAAGDLPGEMWATFNYGLALALAGELDRGRTVILPAIEAYASRGEVFWRSWATWSLGAAEYLFGDRTVARELMGDVLRLQQNVRDKILNPLALTIVFACDAHDGEFRRAAKVLGAALTMWARFGASPANWAAFVAPLAQATELVREGIGDEALGQEYARGAAMSDDDAVAYALGADLAPDGAPSASTLTRRQLEVAHLIAEGLTSRDIATRLVISVRTAETHVDHILTKLSFSNRAQIAAWITETQPE